MENSTEFQQALTFVLAYVVVIVIVGFMLFDNISNPINLIKKKIVINEKMFLEITDWQREKFPKSNESSKLMHLADEVEEAQIAIIKGEPDDHLLLEYADCVILLFGAVRDSGFTFDQLSRAVATKHNINKNRKWGEPDSNGVVKHIK